MKKTTILLLAFISFSILGQEKYYTKSGKLVFESSVASFEEVKATNNKVTAILKTDGTFASLALVKGFQFKIALMEEHFNENYIESKKYPKAKFSGKIVDFTLNELSEKESEHQIKGTLSIKEVAQKITITSFIKQVDGIVYIRSNFQVKPEDFDIKIPSIVRKKIAKNVAISLNLALKKK